jgi:hypothetical protein
MGFPADPDEDTTKGSRQFSPLLNSMKSPAEKDDALTLTMVFQALLVAVPALLSFPPVAST